MNNRQRKDLSQSAELLAGLRESIEAIRDEEQEKVDTLESDFPGHARLEELQQSAEALEEISGYLEEAGNMLTEISEAP